MIDAREIYDEAIKRMENENARSENDYYAFVDDVVSDFMDNGRMDQEDDEENFRENIKMLWEQKARGSQAEE